MLRRVKLTGLAIGLILLVGTATAPAQSIAPDSDYDSYDDYDRARIDRYLDVEVWADHSDGEYYEGDNVVIHFRVNRDAFVSLYSVDTRGRVNLLFPTFPDEDNYVVGGITYDLPGNDAGYDLEVAGPEGFENIQIIASREQFTIPDWYNGPELVVYDEDVDEYMDWVNSTYFVRYGGQRFAFDRAVIYVNEWEQEYFRPIYYPRYPSWTIYGNTYIDYPYGASIYINGIYWGCAPMYIPRIAVGWHTITMYDHYGHCWEHDYHVSRYNTVVFDRTIINMSPSVKSKYKEVQLAGYRDPVQHGYPDFDSRRKVMAGTVKSGSTVGKVDRSGKTTTSTDAFDAPAKKYVRGSSKLVKTSRGYETDAATAVFPTKTDRKQGSTSRVRKSSATGNESSSIKGRSSDGSRSGNRSSSGTTGSPKSSSGSKSTISAGKSGSGSSSSGKVTSSGKSGSSLRKTTGSSSTKGKGSSGPSKIEKSAPKEAPSKKEAPAKVAAPKKTESPKAEKAPKASSGEKPQPSKSKSKPTPKKSGGNK